MIFGFKSILEFDWIWSYLIQLIRNFYIIILFLLTVYYSEHDLSHFC